MSIFLDTKYLMLVSTRLPRFKRKQDNVFNCRCILCGDSIKHTTKARGYFFSYKNEIRYKCHKCGASMSFGNFLKTLDSNVYKEYSVEKYTEGGSRRLNTANLPLEINIEQPNFQNKRLLDSLLDRLDTLPDENEAVQFCIKRNIPRDRFSDLYYIENVSDIVQLSEKYRDKINSKEPRLIIPFYDGNDKLVAVTCRALRNESLRYITVKIDEDAPIIFGLDKVNKNNIVYVTEGPLDSLFVPNCIAMAGTAFGKIKEVNLDINNLVLIFDNQPRNKSVCKIIERNIDAGYRVVIWPETILEKDINDMVLSGLNVDNIIKNNTFEGLAAKMRFATWKRC